MDTLNFLAVKAIVDNLEFPQTLELFQMLSKKVHRGKVEEIKTKLTEKLSQYKELIKYIPLVEKIEDISVSDDDTIFEFNDNPRYKIESGEDINVYVFGEKKFGTRIVATWRLMERATDPVTYDYLLKFGHLFQSYLELDDGTELEWGNEIRDYLSDEGKELKL